MLEKETILTGEGPLTVIYDGLFPLRLRAAPTRAAHVALIQKYLLSNETAEYNGGDTVTVRRNKFCLMK